MKAKKVNPRKKITSKKPLIKSTNQFPVVGIGASAGGLDAFKKLLKAIPEDSGMAFVLVQHLDPKHESMLPELLQKVTNIPVMEISDDIIVLPDHIYIIPSNKMLMSNDGVLKLTPRPAKRGNNLPRQFGERNHPIDLFFTSLAEVHQSHAIGVVLSGTATDGTLGLKAIKDHGGITFAQDAESAAYEGMPHSAVQAGVVDFILPPEKIPQKLLELTNIIKGNDHSEEDLPQQIESIYKQILSLLRLRKGTDFTYYKQTTIRRRILRRMAINKNNDLSKYLKYLRENKAEQDVLYQDMLIPVTSFFRDPKTFENLCGSVFPHIIKNKAAGVPIRVWVAGCSTGEEAYSLAICIKEYLGETTLYNGESVQIFATDISEPAIAKARSGMYTKSNIEGLSAIRLQKYFTKINGNYQVNKLIRDICVFAVHNFLKDPPFGRMDLISCRNVLIYMEPYLQKKALNTFHYSLNPKGFLLLGKSETTNGISELYLAVGKNDKLFCRKDAPGRYIHTTSHQGEQIFANADVNKISTNSKTDFQKTAEDILLSKYTPAGVVVNEAMDIVYFRGNSSKYLQQSSGKPSHNLLKMAKEGLAFELRNIIHKTKKEKAPVIKENIPVKVNDILQHINIEALQLPDTIEPHYLVLFHDSNYISKKESARGKKKPGKSIIKNDDKDIRILQLEKELAQSREDMRSITEDQESVNEELQSANEELLSSSEELQSLNEELETGKEELQSTNEELMVVNHEMISLNEEATIAKEFAEAIIANIREPLLVMDKEFRIKKANNSFYSTFKVTEDEIKDILIYNICAKQWDIPELRTLLEKILPDKTVFNGFKVTHTFPSFGKRIMFLNAREVINKKSDEKLILLSIEDITEQTIANQKIQEIQEEHVKEMEEKVLHRTLELRNANKELQKKNQEILIAREKLHNEYSRRLIEASLDPLVTISAEGKITDVNEASVLITGIKREKLIGTSFSEYFTEPKKAQQAYLLAFEKGFISDFPLTIKHLNGEKKDVLYNASVYKNDNGAILGVFASARDVTTQNRIANDLKETIEFAEMATLIAVEAKNKAESATKLAEEAVKAKQQFLSNMSHEIRTPMNAIIGFTKVVLKTELTTKQKEYVTAIKLSGNALIVLINDILDLAKVDAGKMTFEEIPFKISSSIKTMGQLLESKIQEKNLKLINKYDDSIPEVLLGDPVRLHQIILNLMSNAVKFTSKGKITLSVRKLSGDETGDSVNIEFVVSDTGMGIPENEIKKIFENFHQVSSDTSRLHGGTGLGLAIAKQLVESQGGQLHVKSVVGKGSTFSFNLHFKKTDAKAVLETELQKIDTEGKSIKVLVVEDMALNQLLMKTILDDFGFDRDIASNGKIAIEKLQDKDYDIILMDLHMPEMNGFEATAHIRNKMNSAIPIIALTADVTTVDFEKCKAAGMNDYIAKPIDERLLYSKIIGLVKKSLPAEPIVSKPLKNNSTKKTKYIDLEYLRQRTKSDTSLMKEMIMLYLEQTPPLVRTMKQSMKKRDWNLLHATVHKMIPSFSIMGIEKEYEKIATKIQEYTRQKNENGKTNLQQQPDSKVITELVFQLEKICLQACMELEKELIIIQNNNHE